MKILGIETSCDETSCAVVEDGYKVLSNVIASQIDLHAKTGGVVPEIAAREHVLKIIPVLDEALALAGCSLEDIDAIAVTQRPGLISSLIIGTEAANVISYLKNKPLIPVQHITGHIYSNWLSVGDFPKVPSAALSKSFDPHVQKGTLRSKFSCRLASSTFGKSPDIEEPIPFPILILTVSGGHNDLILMRDHHKFEVLGETLDDASGEAFDKVARILGLGYPGGPAISKIAVNGNRTKFRLPKANLGKDSINFSFSGLKTAVLNEVKAFINKNRILSEAELPLDFKADMAACFEQNICEVLADKLVLALQKNPKVKEVHLAGGVSANVHLREVISSKLPKNVIFRHPKAFAYCTDNAAMIASAGYYLWKSNPKKFKPKTNIIPETSFEI